MRSHYSDVPAYETKDGSEIRELMHPDRHGIRKQSLAEAIVYPGQETVLHKHVRSEELYYITAGSGLMTLGDTKFEVHAGDTIGIVPGTPHCIQNSGNEPLKILCCCSPPYSHDDTILLTGPAGTSQA
jgi:mannose-6-phosphate isomerase-like protein (cupin superfamily)